MNHWWESLVHALESMGIRIGLLIAGFAGGLASLLSLEGLTRSQTILAVFISMATAAYLTPVVVFWTGVKDESLGYGMAFILGLCAMKLVPLLRNGVPTIITAIVKRRAGVDIQPTQGAGGDK